MKSTPDTLPKLLFSNGLKYPDAVNYNENANIDDGTCRFVSADLNNDEIIDILDILIMINLILEN